MVFEPSLTINYTAVVLTIFSFLVGRCRHVELKSLIVAGYGRCRHGVRLRRRQRKQRTIQSLASERVLTPTERGHRFLVLFSCVGVCLVAGICVFGT